MFSNASMPRWQWLIPVVLLMVGCGGAAPAADTQLPPATQVSPASQAPTGSPTTAEPTGPAGGSLIPQRVSFQSSGGVEIAALYWPPIQASARGVVLMHMMGGSKNDWGQFATLLQGAAIAHAGADQALNSGFAVLAIDFRGHGESGGKSSDRPGMLEDARAALSFIRGMPDVDKARIIMIGASIGGDAAVDACGDGCSGVISLSPGGFLGVSYDDALRALGSKPVLCVAAADDHLSADTCTQGESVGLDDYQVQIYRGWAHGTAMFDVQDQKPVLTDFLFAWLRGHVG